MHRALSSIASSAVLVFSTAAFAQTGEIHAAPVDDQSGVEAEPADSDSGTTEPAASDVGDEQREEWESQLEVAAEEACARAYMCATENVPRLVRRTIKRDQVCEVYQSDSQEGRDAALDQECVSASLDYLGCVRSSSCDDLTGSGSRACAARAEAVEQACDND